MPSIRDKPRGLGAIMRRAGYIGHILLTAFVAGALLPTPAHAQKGLPNWVDEGWRNAKYPQSEWYAGFSQDVVRQGTNVAEVQKRVEKEAQNRMAQGISVRIAATSSTQTTSSQTRDAKGVNETVKKEYGQIIEATTNAEVVKSELYSHNDPAGGKVYAFAAVKKSELAAYYTSRIQFYLQTAENDFSMAKQFADSDKKGSALEKTAESKKSIAECGKYQELLSAVDYKGDAAMRFLGRGAALSKEISAFEIKLRESGAVYITGKETIAGQNVDRVVSALQSKFSENKCRVADRQEDAGYVLRVTVKECNVTENGKFTYCYACVNADLVSTKTGKSESKISFTGPKTGWTNAKTACEKAFDEAVDELWMRIRNKTEICK